MNRTLSRKYVEMRILDMLRESPLHGYALAKKMCEITGFKPSYAMIYPVLKNLSEKGLVEITLERVGNRVVKVYRLTEKGVKYLEENSELIKRLKTFEDKLKALKNTGLPTLIPYIRRLYNEVDKLPEEKIHELRLAVEEFREKIRRILGVD